VIETTNGGDPVLLNVQSKSFQYFQNLGIGEFKEVLDVQVINCCPVIFTII